jgi:hypothetical protein
MRHAAAKHAPAARRQQHAQAACGMQMRKKGAMQMWKRAQGQNGHFKSKYMYFLKKSD